jgi:nitrite reductase (NO-forming)
MKNQYNHNLIRSRWGRLLARLGSATAVLALLTASPAWACEGCNIAFGQEMENQRADSLIAREFRAAAENQRNLPIKELGSGAFQPRLAALPQALPAALAQAGTEATPEAAPARAARPAAAPVAAAPRAAGAPYDTVPEEWKDDQFIEIIERDYALPVPATSYVPQDTPPDKSFTVTLEEGKAYIGNGVIYDGFLTNGSVPGPLIVVDEGDIVEMIIENHGQIPHGASIHAAYTQTSKYLGRINPGSSGRVVFRATHPGVYMYHCAPGGHAIPMHVLFGQYGMMVVKPKKQVYEMERVMGRKPDLELYLIQHELYASGKDAMEGRALYTTFNGKLFRYIEEPIPVRPGDYVRIYFLNVGPNLLSTFHIVGVVWDYVYWQGQPSVAWPGGQSVTAGPTDSFVIDFRIPPDEGAYTMLSHAVGSTARGAIGLLVASADAETPAMITPEGLIHSAEEMAEIEAKAVRTISPFKPTDYDGVTRYAPGTREVEVSIIGNSFYPKVIEIEPGTTVRWVNEEAFAYLAGEFSGIHNAVGDDGGDNFFSTPLLAHAESATHLFEHEGEYNYICAPHPYMEGRIIVKTPEIDLSNMVAGGGRMSAGYLLPLAVAAFLVALLSLFRARSPTISEE